ncbi:transferase [Embleya scabrispora]|uniref:Transferase n=1 Tax=Embleya scabrispora TaxID=159449 RepID=A0A1T3P7J4_9ACTN|nr:DUF5941 domain-containing protein [Embleya scabrispora]OPC85013.1 transferase [Embleya scabrispora]
MEVAAPDALRAALAAGEDRITLVDARFVGHRHALRLVIADTRFPAAHVPGVLAVEGEARAEAARIAAGLDRPAADACVPDLIAERLVAAGVSLREVPLGELLAEVPRDEDARARAVAAVAAVDDERIRLASAVKARDGFFTTFAVSTWSRYLARWCARRGLTPNQVTVASLLVALAAAAGAATGTRAGYIGAALGLYFSFVLDCTDGQLARYAVSYSRIGSWLDATFDRAKEYAVYAGLALGAARHDDDVWTLALVAMVVMTTRHIVDFAFNETRRGIGGGGDDDGADGGAGAKLSGKLNTVGWTVWARRMIILPIGERWALIALLTATTTPRITFVVLITGCVLAACYTSLGRVLRSLPRRTPAAPQVGEHLAALADSGPIAELVARLRPRVPAPAAALLGTAALLAVLLAGGAGEWWGLAGAGVYALCAGAAIGRPLVRRLDWVVPPIFRAAEYAAITILAAQVVPTAVAAAFGLVAATAYHHYDTVYRLRGGYGAPPRALVWAVLGHEGRVLLVTVLAAAGSNTLRTGLIVTAGVLAAIVLAESVAFWVRGARPDIDDATPVGPAPSASAPSYRPLEAVVAAAPDRTGDLS